MPFTKETASQAGKQNKGVPKAKTQAWENIVGWLIGEGGHKYLELLEIESSGEKLIGSQQDFMDRFEKLLEYHQPKLGRMEMSAKVEMGIDDSQLNTIVDAYLRRGSQKSSNKKNT